MITRQKGFGQIIYIVLILIGVAAVGVYYYLTSKGVQVETNNPTYTQLIPDTKPDETANWKIYTNEKYGYSIKYPPSWNYLDVPDTTYKEVPEAVWLYSGNPPPLDTDAAPDVWITVSSDTVDPYSAKWMSENLEETSIVSVKVGNFAATKISSKYKESGWPLNVVYGKIDKFYFQFHTNNSTEAVKYFDQILSTFKFTDK